VSLKLKSLSALRRQSRVSIGSQTSLHDMGTISSFKRTVFQENHPNPLEIDRHPREIRWHPGCTSPLQKGEEI
jgi:hypothetical protein